METVKMIDEYSWKLGFPETSHKFPSVTEPDQSYSIAELLQRHKNGILTDTELGRDSFFNEDADFDSEDFEKFNDADLTTKTEYFEARRAELDEIEKANAAKVAADKKALDDEFDEFKKAKAAKPVEPVPGAEKAPE